MERGIFRFKQFFIRQEFASHKVGTDSVMFGSWVHASNPANILDIGTGTGLLALMLAQRFHGAVIDAIELDKEAFIEASLNFSYSPWFDRLNAIHADFNDWHPKANKKYDLIISNPPYFHQSLKPPSNKKALARHQDSLDILKLIAHSITLLSSEGTICLILPLDAYIKVKQYLISETDYAFSRCCRVRGTASKDPNIMMMNIAKQPPGLIHESITIRQSGTQEYTTAYLTLTEAFYPGV